MKRTMFTGKNFYVSHCIISVLLLTAILPAPLAAQNSAKTPSKIVWIAHRGESLAAPENTLPAFRLALQKNADGIECDVRLTADKKLIAMHDATTKRTGKINKIISQSTYSDLQKLDVSYNKRGYSNTKIPLFSEVLKILGDRCCYVEIKTGDTAVIDAVVKCVEEAAIPKEQIILISFNSNIIKKYKERYPDRKALWLADFRAFPNGTWRYTAEQLIAKLKEIKADGIDIHANFNFLNKQYVKKVKDAGFFFAVYTVDSVYVARRLAAMGVDSITSNRAGYLKSKLSK